VHPRIPQSMTEEEEAGRARAALEQFATDHHKVIASEYLENTSGATADRPELPRLIREARWVMY
jgi:DNA invertase Pin-like site-specific DNA recombinase